MLISVVIPTYNRRRQVCEAIDSALAQAGVEVEVVVVDDGSTDDTLSWLAQQYPQEPVRVVSNTGEKGPAGARNTGIAAALGGFVALLDSDDRFLPGHLASAMQVLLERRGVEVVFGPARYLRKGQPIAFMRPNFEAKLKRAPKVWEDDSVAVFSSRFFEQLLIDGCWFNLSSVVLSRRAAEQGLREDLRAAEDYEFWVRLARQFGFACLKQEQIEYTLGEDNASFAAAASLAHHSPQMLRAYHHMLGYPGLTAAQRRLIESRAATEYFHWGYRAAVGGEVMDACRLHARSFRYGLRVRNVAAICKTVARSVVRRRPA
jgi:glycosyltransferase involved in cell wall biosynthesis